MPAAAPAPLSQQEILESALAALTAADIPPGDDAGRCPTLTAAVPAELAGLAAAELDQLAAAGPVPVPRWARPGSSRGTGPAAAPGPRGLARTARWM